MLVAEIGVAAVFALNTVALLLYAIVVAAHPHLGGPARSSERFLPGLRAGGRYVRNSPVVRRILLRAALFLVPGSSLWALLPLVATTRLALGAEGWRSTRWSWRMAWPDDQRAIEPSPRCSLRVLPDGDYARAAGRTNL